MRHPSSRRIAASKQSRYLRDVSRAVEALVLSAWYAPVGRPSSHLQASLPALRCSSDGKAALSEPVLAEMLAVVSYTMESDGSLGPARSRSRPPEVRAAMSEGISQAMLTADGLSGLSSLLGLDDAPMSLETFDISHLYGTNTVGACSALSLGMTALDQYCCYPIRGVAPADDTGAISAALREHLGSGARPPPSVLLIDGGKGQLSAALTVLNELGLGDTVGLLAIAKREEVRLRACGAKGFGGGVSLEGSTVGPDVLGLQSSWSVQGSVPGLRRVNPPLPPAPTPAPPQLHPSSTPALP